MTVRPRDLLYGLRDLKLGQVPVIVHASLRAFGQVDGGAQTVVSALAAVFPTIVVPTFTYKTMITPLVGPEDNGISYGAQQDLNRMAEFFTPELPADRMMGLIPETLRRQPEAKRSMHPILSFAGMNAEAILASQTIPEPLKPLEVLAALGSWVVLLGVDHTTNTSIHCAERLAGRRQFVRWALTPRGVVECPGFPGCSAGFQAIAPELERHTRRVAIGPAQVQAVPMEILFSAVVNRIEEDPLSLLCQRRDCERCNQVRRWG